MSFDTGEKQGLHATRGEVLLGDVRALARQAGGLPLSASDASGGGAGIPMAMVHWREWVGRYVREVVVGEEWPVVLEAWSHASAGRVKELLMLDQSWGVRVGMRPLAEASFRVGQRQLNRLRPLGDVRVVQRYLAAVEAGKAHGWHPVVYGVMLAVFALPLRQGLMHYADQVLGGFVEGVPAGVHLREGERAQVLEELGASLPGALGRLLPAVVPMAVV